ncbi:mechanosensitive ion channel family protein [Streptococcus hyovaginalis]|uniref:mechanosensitive ion channel family protein n=1 Tax=Streptococcus hyovaginalis TaxID=149015 RepID=UPI002A84097E|nr:mechanosensitive ion channel family protein [Streptococcus hyovaginalis]MDY4510229.1 mechanosensitive ion channel family protein [Streptococcus hyovaginalis]
MTYIENYWNKLQLEVIAENIISKTVSLVLLLILFTILKKLLDTLFTKTIERSISFTKQSPMRQRTMTKLLHNVMNYALYFLLAYWILSILGIPVSSLLAGAGIAGVAVGLGAQGFLSDMVNGFFILFENQLEVDETVEVGDISGTVASVGIRTTQIVGFDGTLHFIPNRNISTVSNQSRGNMRAQIDLPIYTHTNLDKVDAIIQTVNNENVSRYPEIINSPDIIGAIMNNNNQLVFRVNIFVQNGQQYRIAPAFFQLYQTALLEAGIQLPTVTPISPRP